MQSTRLDAAGVLSSRDVGPNLRSEKFIEAREFRALMVSHRRMVREDQASSLVKGLRDLDTGEVFLIDERRLYEAKR